MSSMLTKLVFGIIQADFWYDLKNVKGDYLHNRRSFFLGTSQNIFLNLHLCHSFEIGSFLFVFEGGKFEAE